MKILYVGRSCHIGGVPSVRLRAARGLIARGHEIHLLAQGGPLLPEFKSAGVDVHLTGPTPFNRLHLAWLLKQNHFDLVHADNAAAGEDVVAAMKWARLKTSRKPAVVVAVHGLFNPKVTSSPSLPLSDRVLVFDSSTIERLRQLEGMETHPIDIVRRPVEARSIPIRCDPTPHFVFVSRLSKTKGKAALAAIEAVEELANAWWPDIRLTIVGDGSQRQDLQRLADSLNARQGREVVRLVGALKDPFPIMASATGVIGTAMVAMEALFHGIPVVAAGYQGYGIITPENLREAVECNFGDAVLQPRAVTKELVWEGMKHILTQREAAQEKLALSQVSRRIREEHGVEKVALGLERIYAETLSARDVQVTRDLGQPPLPVLETLKEI